MVFSLIEWIVLFFIVIVSFSITVIILYKKLFKRRWNYTYNVLEDAEGKGNLIPTKRGVCRLVKISDSGAEIFYLPKEKKYKTAYGKRSGHNHIIWAVDSAGYWHNVYFGNLDKKLNEIGINITSAQARYGEASLRKIIAQNYINKSFMDKYGTIIAFGMN